MTSTKVQKICEQFKLPFGYFNGREIVPNKKNLNTKTASDRRKTLYQFLDDHFVIWTSKGISLSQAAEQVREIFLNREVITEDKVIFN